MELLRTTFMKVATPILKDGSKRHAKAKRKKKERGLQKRSRLQSARGSTRAKQVETLHKPISLKEPSSTDRKANRILHRLLSQCSLQESDVEAEAREVVLQEINDLCKEWVRQSIARQKNISPSAAELGTCLCHSFGSFRLGVHSPGADIDLLVIGPRYVTREHFFTEFVEQLRKNERVQAILAVQEAYVPLLKFKFDGVDIDMVYACVGFEYIDPNTFDIFSDETLAHVDAKSVLSLNGARVTDTILRLVPNDKVFRQSLRAIRFWAQRRGIYSNVMGYLGGVSWAILVAHICQLYPNANEAIIILRFFTFFDLWKFSHERPIRLCKVKDNADLNFSNWDPDTNEREKFDILPIITPVYPTMNSTHNVIPATNDVLKTELHRARAILSRTKKGEPISEELWLELFAERNFFIEHKQYICVKTGSQFKDDQVVWRGFVESKLRSFAQRLHEDRRVCAIPWPYPITKVPQPEKKEGEETSQYEHWFFVGLDIDRSALGQGQKINLRPAVQHFHKMLTFSNVAAEREVNANIRCYNAKNLPPECLLSRDFVPQPTSIPRTQPAARLQTPEPPTIKQDAQRSSSPSDPPSLMETPSPPHSTTSSSPSGPELPLPPLEEGELPGHDFPPDCPLARADEENRRRRKKEERKKKRKRKREQETSGKKDGKRRKRQKRDAEEGHKKRKKRHKRDAETDTGEKTETKIQLQRSPSTRKKRKKHRRDAVTAIVEDSELGDAIYRKNRRLKKLKRRIVVAETVSEPGNLIVKLERGCATPPPVRQAIVLNHSPSDSDERDDGDNDPPVFAPWTLVNAMAVRLKGESAMAARLNMEKGREQFRKLRRLAANAPDKRLYRDKQGKWNIEKLQTDIEQAKHQGPVTIDLTNPDEKPKSSKRNGSSSTASGKTSKTYNLGDMVTVRLATSDGWSDGVPINWNQVAKGRWSRGQIATINANGTYDVYFPSRDATRPWTNPTDIRSTIARQSQELASKATAHILDQPPPD